MKVIQVPTGQLAENCYFIMNEDTKETLVIDPGADAQKLKDIIEKEGLKPVAIALTHCHYDHIGAVDAIRQAYHIPVYVHHIEQAFLTNPEYNLSSRHFPDLVTAQPADVLFEQMGPVTIEGFACRIEHVPGHSPGSIVYLFEQDTFAIVGDTLFKGGCGRTDLPFSSSHAELMVGITKHLVTLPDDTVVYAGHGQATTIGQEKATNPYLNGATR